MVVVSFISCLKGGGAEFLVREVHKSLIERGIDSRAYFFSGNKSSLGFREYVFGLGARNPFNILKVRRLLKSFKKGSSAPLIVHVHLSWPLFFVAIASVGIQGLKLVYTEHSTNNKRRSFPLMAIMERFVYARYSQVICISEATKDSLGVWLGIEFMARLVVVPNGAKIHDFCTRQPLVRRKARLVSVGSLSTKKNFVTTIKAISQLTDVVEEYVVVGEGPERSSFEHIIDEYQLNDLVSLVGWTDSVEEYLYAADIQLIPSLWEGFGLVAVEGMSTGISIVASNVDGLREVVGCEQPFAHLVDNPKSSEEWCVAIRNSINDLSLDGQALLGSIARARSQKFTLESMVDGYLEVYRLL
jgi:glycosyltransferase involved in cell wall biosynthesis